MGRERYPGRICKEKENAHYAKTPQKLSYQGDLLYTRSLENDSKEVKTLVRAFREGIQSGDNSDMLIPGRKDMHRGKSTSFNRRTAISFFIHNYFSILPA